ncbi:sensor histidine kinase, partial [Paenibacillus koleovorans]|uniref:sensor histidine kinase n=1 Tax=Paenibacillus koleovorans TaxID=121608 RepID=UPI0013E30B33
MMRIHYKKLSTQIFIYFLIVIVVSLGVVGVFSYLQSSKELDRQTERNISQAISNALYQTDLYMQTYERVSDSILSNNDVKRFLEIDPNDSYSNFYYTDQIRKYVFQPTFILHPQINLIYVIGDHGRAVSDDNAGQSFSPYFQPMRQLSLLRTRTPDNGSIAILNSGIVNNPQNSVITMARKIRGMYTFESRGVLAIEFKTRELDKIWGRLDIGESGFFFIVDEQGELVYEPSHPAAGKSITPDVLQTIMESKQGSFMQTVQGRERMIVSVQSEYSRWHLAASIPVQELRQPISTIRTTTLIVGGLTLLFAMWLAVRFGRSLLRPIHILKNGMRETEKGNWNYIEDTQRKDELGGLIRSYNLMVSRLAEMIDRVYEAELRSHKTMLDLQSTRMERQRAEFQALQLQINPHFLYNTLETINCYAVVQDSDEIPEMVDALASMLRYSVQTNLEQITVVNELKHILNYMTILKHRIGREFEIDVRVPPGMLLEQTVRLTLQPLVENAFQHAFQEGLHDEHYIRIDARFEADRFLVTVEDNGAGIPPRKLEQLRAALGRNRLAEPEAGGGAQAGGGAASGDTGGGGAGSDAAGAGNGPNGDAASGGVGAAAATEGDSGAGGASARAGAGGEAAAGAGRARAAAPEAGEARADGVGGDGSPIGAAVAGAANALGSDGDTSGGGTAATDGDGSASGAAVGVAANAPGSDGDTSGGGPRRKGGIGLLNVHRRIQLVFGEQYGLQLESEHGVGTTIIMSMPRTRTAELPP